MTRRLSCLRFSFVTGTYRGCAAIGARADVLLWYRGKRQKSWRGASLWKFRLSTDAFYEALAVYLPYCEIVEVTRKCSVACRDPKDQSFLDLVHSGKADSLVSGDRNLVVLAGKTKFPIETPGEYRRRAERN